MTFHRFAASIIAATAFALTALPAAAAPSFDCGATNRNTAEHTICRSRYLSALDRRMSRKYFNVRAMLSPWARRRLRRTQRQWLAQRNDCGIWRRCIASHYGRRIRQLNQFANCFDDSASPRCIGRALRRHARSTH